MSHAIRQYARDVLREPIQVLRLWIEPLPQPPFSGMLALMIDIDSWKIIQLYVGNQVKRFMNQKGKMRIQTAEYNTQEAKKKRRKIQ